MNTETPVPLRRRSLRFRCSALAWAVAIAVGVLGDALAERDCRHHEADEHAGHAAHAGEHGSHHRAHGEHAARDADRESESHVDPCLCLGSCQAGSAVALGAHHARELGHALTGAAADPIRPTEDDLPGRAPFVLPFANAPPFVA